MTYPFRRNWGGIEDRFGPHGRDSESNKTLISLIIKEPIMVEGVEFFPFVAYSTGKIYMNVAVTIQEANPLHTAQYNLISASFTGFSKDQGNLYIRGTYMRKKGSVGMFVEKSDLELIIKIIKSYNETLGLSTTVVMPDPNIIDVELFEI